MEVILMAEIVNELIDTIDCSVQQPETTSVSQNSDYIEEAQTMTVAECQVETQKHIENVRKYIRFIIDKLDLRGVKHDASKLKSPEVELFAEHTLQLANLSYGSDEYKASLEALKPALEHHYASNRHHPEHFTEGVNDMTLIDIIEMFCDWKASTLRHNDGNLLKSIELNAERFHIDGQLKQILMNTARMLDEHE
jgi:hypothetical protein